MGFLPVNGQLLIERLPKEEDRELVLPEGTNFSNQERYKAVKFVACAPECSPAFQDLKGGEIIFVDASMIEDVRFSEEEFVLVGQGFVVGVLNGI